MAGSAESQVNGQRKKPTNRGGRWLGERWILAGAEPVAPKLIEGETIGGVIDGTIARDCGNGGRAPGGSVARHCLYIGDAWEHEANRAKLVQWHWNGVFGELYGSAVETRIARDFTEVPLWLKGGPEPSTVSETIFRATV